MNDKLSTKQNASMETSKKSTDYMFLFRGTDWHQNLSPEEAQQVMTDWMAWFERLTKQGKVVSGHPLEKEGVILSGKNGQIIADGPFAESKEAVGGYFYLKVSGMDEALAIARQCPGLGYGIQIEVRPVADMCPAARQLGLQAEYETAVTALA
jgi:hypothetical protein